MHICNQKTMSKKGPLLKSEHFLKVPLFESEQSLKVPLFESEQSPPNLGPATPLRLAV